MEELGSDFRCEVGVLEMDGSDNLKDHMKRKHGELWKEGKNEEREESGKIEEERNGWFWTGQGAVFTC